MTPMILAVLIALAGVSALAMAVRARRQQLSLRALGPPPAEDIFAYTMQDDPC